MSSIKGMKKVLNGKIVGGKNDDRCDPITLENGILSRGTGLFKTVIKDEWVSRYYESLINGTVVNYTETVR